MTKDYEPASNFLRAVARNGVPLSGSTFGDANFQQLIELTADTDESNRVWATFFLSQSHVNTKQVRDALLRAASDGNERVRGQAILGLAWRDRRLAMPLLRDALAQKTAATPVFEAAWFLADPLLIDDLRRFAENADHDDPTDPVMMALEACLFAASPKPCAPIPRLS